jgi:hypothetical protein
MHFTSVSCGWGTSPNVSPLSRVSAAAPRQPRPAMNKLRIVTSGIPGSSRGSPPHMRREAGLAHPRTNLAVMSPNPRGLRLEAHLSTSMKNSPLPSTVAASTPLALSASRV